MKYAPLVLFAATLVISCTSKPKQEGFSLTATARNIPDSAMVYISKDNIRIDSAMVMNEKFSFKGRVEEPSNVWLSIPQTQDYISMWVENTNIQLQAEKGQFDKAVITGSPVQKESDLLSSKLSPFTQARDSARAALAGKNLTAAEQNEANSFFDKLRRQEHEATQDFVKEHPNSIVSAYILNFYKTTWGKRTTAELNKHLTQQRRESTDGKMISRFLELNKNFKVGDHFEDFEMTNAEGKQVRLSNIKGKYTLVYFWAAHCYYSAQENPNLIANYERFEEHGLEILGVSIDEDPKTFRGSIEEHQLPWNNLMSTAGRDNKAALIYGISGTPENFLMDENGNILAFNIRGEELTKKLQELMPAADGV
jgi:peroxiredoxin